MTIGKICTCYYDFGKTYIKGKFVKETPEFIVLSNPTHAYIGIDKEKELICENNECFVNKSLIKYVTVAK